MASNVVALVSDLLFASRIKSAAQGVGAAVRIVRSTEAMEGAPGSMLLVDLGMPGAIEAAARWRAATGSPVVGFVSHVDAETAARGRAAGIDRVIARGRFVETLGELLSQSRGELT